MVLYLKVVVQESWWELCFNRKKTNDMITFQEVDMCIKGFLIKIAMMYLYLTHTVRLYMRAFKFDKFGSRLEKGIEVLK